MMITKMHKELLLGCGNRKLKDIRIKEEKWSNLTTLDIDPNCEPDVLWDLEERPLPFSNEEFDEIHAYEVLEHIGEQGNVEKFFEEFGEYWRILKFGGFLIGTSPKYDSMWAWGDPGHRRIISRGLLSFLGQDFYKQIGNTKASDYRYLWNKDFALIVCDEKDDLIYFIIQKK